MTAMTRAQEAKVLIWEYEMSTLRSGVHQSYTLKKITDNGKVIFKYKASQESFFEKTEEEKEKDALQQRRSFGTVAALQEVPPPSPLKTRKIAVGFKKETIHALFQEIIENHPVSVVQDFQEEYKKWFHLLYFQALSYEE